MRIIGKRRVSSFCSEKVLEKMCVCGWVQLRRRWNVHVWESICRRKSNIHCWTFRNWHEISTFKNFRFFWHFDFVVGLLWPFPSAPFHQEMHVGPRPGSDETGESTPGVLVVTPLRLEARNESPKITQNNGKQLRVVDWLIRFVHGNVIKGSSVAKLPSYRVLSPPHHSHLTTSLITHIIHISHHTSLTTLTSHITSHHNTHITHISNHFSGNTYWCWSGTFCGKRDIWWCLSVPCRSRHNIWWCWSVMVRGRCKIWWCWSVTFLRTRAICCIFQCKMRVRSAKNNHGERVGARWPLHVRIILGL